MVRESGHLDSVEAGEHQAPSRLLEIRSLHGGYGTGAVLHGIDLEVESGELVGVIGVNGAGKTSLLRAISGMLRIDSGEILLGQESLIGKPSHRIARMGVAHVPQERHLFPTMTVWENLQLGTSPSPRRERKAALERFELVTELFPVLGERRNQLAQQLSGGQQQMLAIGRALMSNPKILLLDEPSLGLAPAVAAAISRAIQALASQGLTAILVEQAADLALRSSHRSYVMRGGRVVLEGRSAELLSDREHLTHAYFGEPAGPARSEDLR